MTAQFVFAVTESVGVEWMTNGAYRDVAERVVSAAVQFTMDGSPQARSARRNKNMQPRDRFSLLDILEGL